MDKPTEFHVDDVFEHKHEIIFLDEVLFAPPEVWRVMNLMLTQALDPGFQPEPEVNHGREA